MSRIHAFPHILVVDDREEIAEVLSLTVSDWKPTCSAPADGSTTVHVCANGAEACAYLEKELPDGVISDVHMPVMRGDALLQWIRDRGLRIPVLLASADYDDDMIRLASRFGAAFVKKPFNTGSIEHWLAKNFSPWTPRHA